MGDWEDMYGNSEADNDAFYDMLDASYRQECESIKKEYKLPIDENEFVPRWGTKVFECKYCGAGNMKWTELFPDTWKPFDLLNSCIHECSAYEPEKITQDKVLEHLQDIGFEGYTPRTSSWKHVFVASNKTQSLYFLVGKRGIDFKFYESSRSLKQDEKGRVYTDGGVFVRNYYYGSDINIHDFILDLASRFVTDTPIDINFFTGHGINWATQKAEYIQRLNE